MMFIVNIAPSLLPALFNLFNFFNFFNLFNLSNHQYPLPPPFPWNFSFSRQVSALKHLEIPE